MNKADKDMHLKLTCLNLAVEIELNREVEYDIPRIFVRANELYNQANKWGYMDLVSPYDEPTADINYQLKKKLGVVKAPKTKEEAKQIKEQQKEVKDAAKGKPTEKRDKRDIAVEEMPTMTATGPTPPEGMKACPSCGEWVPVKWENHPYKRDGTRCGHNL